MGARFSAEEIKKAIWGFDSNKSPGPDGYSFAFIKANRENMEGEVLRMMDEFHEKGKRVRGLNASFMVLIRKKGDYRTLDEYSPISLVGCLHKIIAKTLANRLSKVIEEVISDNQFAFIGGRQISGWYCSTK